MEYRIQHMCAEDIHTPALLLTLDGDFNRDMKTCELFSGEARKQFTKLTGITYIAKEECLVTR
jgi:hypothetical protein